MVTIIKEAKKYMSMLGKVVSALEKAYKELDKLEARYDRLQGSYFELEEACKEVGKEREDELVNGQVAAELSVAHLECMGSEKCSVSVQTNLGCYIVTVRKTL